MSRKKNGLIFYISHYEAIKDSLNDEQLGRLFRLIFEKQLGNEVVLDKDIEIAFNFINNHIYKKNSFVLYVLMIRLLQNLYRIYYLK